jgi:hypothetical protein
MTPNRTSIRSRKIDDRPAFRLLTLTACCISNVTYWPMALKLLNSLRTMMAL